VALMRSATHWAPISGIGTRLDPLHVVMTAIKFWSGARDLNPGPHGPEPPRLRVLECPVGCLSVPLNSIAAAVVSSCELLYPPVSGNA